MRREEVSVAAPSVTRPSTMNVYNQTVITKQMFKEVFDRNGGSIDSKKIKSLLFQHFKQTVGKAVVSILLQYALELCSLYLLVLMYTHV